MRMKSAVRVLCFTACAAICLTGCRDNTEGAASSEPSKDYTYAGEYFDSDIWQTVPMVSQEILDLGYSGGEGSRTVVSLVTDPVKGKLGFMGTDIGGIYKTADGGENWSISTLGLGSSGATGFAIDPANTSRILCVGCGSSASDSNGLYLSTDSGDTWSGVCLQRIRGWRDYRTQIAFDETSYDDKIGGSTTVYWSRENDSSVTENDPAIYKSADGGATWSRLENTAAYAGAYIAVNPTRGWVYTAGSGGVYRSKDGGATFECVLSEPVTSMDVIRTNPDNIYLSSKKGIYISTDAGDSFSVVTGTGYPSDNPVRLRVSPADPGNMALYNDRGTSDTDFGGGSGYYTNDGGASWSVCEYNMTGAFMPMRNSPQIFSWDPRDKNKCLSYRDGCTVSTNGAKTFKWSNDGFCGLPGGGNICFNINHPSWMMVPSAGYNGGYTLDGGKTWSYVDWAKRKNFGYTCCGYIMSESTMFAGTSVSSNGQYDISISFDGGKSITHTDFVITGAKTAMGALGNDDIGFIGEWRTDDGAHVWNVMDGCTGVFDADRSNGDLYGCNGSEAVVSHDNGVTWELITDTGGDITDIDFVETSGRLYICSSGRLLTVEPASEQGTAVQLEFGGGYAQNICADPNNPDTLYLCRSSADNSVLRSLDGGSAWTPLNRVAGDGRSGPDGAVETIAVCINTESHELFAATKSRGVWKLLCH
jgi:hypothetical protein